ncbi:thioredoxin TrxC [Zhongshania arctica]|uniref:Thioredoxin n=1 Tax=Zhongshania arctica TaxID=3238302 RepID=A0ABV3TXI7_9GAMM
MSNVSHIVCPHCLANNRVPSTRLEQSPNCGRCKKSLFNAQAISLSANGFETMISRNDTPVVIDFWAPWCGPCKSMAPAFDQAAKSLEPYLRLAKVNTDVEQAVASRFNIKSLPTLVIFYQGKEIARQSGALDAASIVRWVDGVSGKL